MNLNWLSDGRKIPDEVIYFIQVMAVNAIRIQKAKVQNR
jgi:hypothetical protein